MPDGPPDKVIVLDRNKSHNPQDFANELSKVYDQGFTFVFEYDGEVYLKKGYA